MKKKKNSYWNYRIFKKEYIDFSGQKQIECGIIEVYYKDNKIEGYTADFMAPWGETKKELKQNFNMMKRAFEKSALTIKNLEPKKFAKKKAKITNEKSKC